MGRTMTKMTRCKTLSHQKLFRVSETTADAIKFGVKNSGVFAIVILICEAAPIFVSASKLKIATGREGGGARKNILVLIYIIDVCIAPPNASCQTKAIDQRSDVTNCCAKLCTR